LPLPINPTNKIILSQTIIKLHFIIFFLYNKGYNDNNNNQHLNAKKCKTSKRESVMRKNNSKYLYYTIILLIVLGVVYALFKEITPEQTREEISIELKLNK